MAHDLNNDLTKKMEFEKLWRETPETDRLKLVAGYAFDTSRTVMEFKSQQIDMEKRLSNVESGDRKMSGITGGSSGAITGSVIGMINYIVSSRRS